MHLCSSSALGVAFVRSARLACRDEAAIAWQERTKRWDPLTPVTHKRTMRRIERMLLYAAHRRLISSAGARRLAMAVFDFLCLERRLVIGPRLSTDEEEFWPRMDALESTLDRAWSCEVRRASVARWLGVLR